MATGSTVAHAACWPSGEGATAVYRNPSISDEFKESNFVIIGRVSHQRNVPGPDDPQGYAWTIYDVHVLETFKGRPPHTLQLLSENSSARFPMDVGKSDLLFVDRASLVDRAGNEALPENYIDNCGNSELWDAASEKVRAVRKLSGS